MMCRLTKTALAQQLGVSRASLYYHPKRPALDEEVKAHIEAVLVDNPDYGHKRIALELKLNKKRILRVMKKFGIKPYRRTPKAPPKPADYGKPPKEVVNVMKALCPIAPHIVWVSDFTYLKYHGKFIYLATIMDLYTREVIGVNLSRYHNQELVLGALEDALKHADAIAHYLHSDQGSEYDAQAYQALATQAGLIISMSDKGSPWQNGHQESFYGKFKQCLGDGDRFEALGELVEAIHLAIYRYNHTRIHTTLKMSPVEFKHRYQLKMKDTLSKR